MREKSEQTNALQICTVPCCLLGWSSLFIIQCEYREYCRVVYNTTHIPYLPPWNSAKCENVPPCPGSWRSCEPGIEPVSTLDELYRHSSYVIAVLYWTNYMNKAEGFGEVRTPAYKSTNIGS